MQGSRDTVKNYGLMAKHTPARNQRNAPKSALLSNSKNPTALHTTADEGWSSSVATKMEHFGLTTGEQEIFKVSKHPDCQPYSRLPDSI